MGLPWWRVDLSPRTLVDTGADNGTPFSVSGRSKAHTSSQYHLTTPVSRTTVRGRIRGPFSPLPRPGTITACHQIPSDPQTQGAITAVTDAR